MVAKGGAAFVSQKKKLIVGCVIETIQGVKNLIDLNYIIESTNGPVSNGINLKLPDSP